MSMENSDKWLQKCVFYNDIKNVKNIFSAHGDFSHDNTYSLKDISDDKIQIAIPKNNLKLIHIATAGDALDVFIFLEKHGFTINDATKDNYLPIHYACAFGSYKIVSHILNEDPSMARNEQPGIKYHLLYLSASSGNPAIIELLFKNKIDPKSEANRKNCILDHAIIFSNKECIKLLILNGVEYEVTAYQVYDEYSLPMVAAFNLKPELVEYLLDFDKRPINYCTPIRKKSLLGYLCYYGKLFKPVILKILESDADIEPPIQNVEGPVHWLRKGIDVNRLDQDGLTGFYNLKDKPKITPTVLEIMNLLFKAGFDVNTRGPLRPDGKMPPSVLETFCTGLTKSYPIIELLIENGANIYAKDGHGNRLFDTIMLKRDKRLKELFLKSPLYVPRSFTE